MICLLLDLFGLAPRSCVLSADLFDYERLYCLLISRFVMIDWVYYSYKKIISILLLIYSFLFCEFEYSNQYSSLTRYV